MKQQLLAYACSLVLALAGACSSSDEDAADGGGGTDATAPPADTTTPPGDDSTTPPPGDTGASPADTGGGTGACTLPTDGFDGVDNGDGTVTDKTTKLTWTKTADTKKWDEANTHCDELDLGGKSDWRLPTIEELRSLIVGNDTCQGAALGTTCDVCDDSCADDFDKCVDKCDKCEIVKGPGPGGRYHSDLFPQSMTAQAWSSTLPVFAKGGMAYVVEFRDASVGQGAKMGKFATRCVHE